LRLNHFDLRLTPYSLRLTVFRCLKADLAYEALRSGQAGPPTSRPV